MMDLPFSVTFENIIGHIISFVPGEVDIEIRWRAAVGIDESFEVEVEFERIYVGDAQVVRYDGVGPTTPPHVVVARRGGIADDVPGDEEVSTKAHFLDDLQFLLGAFCGLFVACAVPALAARNGEFGEQVHIVFDIAGEGESVVLDAAVHSGVAGGEQALGILQDDGIPFVELVDLTRPSEVFSLAGAVFGFESTEHDVEVDAAQQLVGLKSIFIAKGNGSKDDEFVELFFEVRRKELVDLFGPDAYVFIVAQTVDGLGQLAKDDVTVGQHRRLLWQGFLAQRVFGEQGTQLPPALVVARDAEVKKFLFIAKLDAEDGFDAILTTSGDKLEGTRSIVDVGKHQ